MEVRKRRVVIANHEDVNQFAMIFDKWRPTVASIVAEPEAVVAVNPRPVSDR